MTKEFNLVPEKSEKYKGKDWIINLWRPALTGQRKLSVKNSWS